MEELIINVKDINKEIKNTKKYLKYSDKNNLKIKYKTNDETLKQIEKAINIKDIKKRYEYIYDTICDYIDKKYITCNYCEFEDNICKYFKEKNQLTHKNGCCFSDSRGGLCKYLDKDHCTIKSISCKLYSCPILRENNINFKIREIPLLKYFFNIKQKYYLKYSFFKDKDYVINKLLEKK